VNRKLEGLRHFVIGLADAREHDLGRVGASRDRARQLTARHDIESAPQACEQVEDAEVRIGLHGVADEVWNAGERCVELTKRVLERGAGIYEAGRSEARRDGRERHAFDGQFAVAIGKRGHYFPPSGCTSGTVRSGVSLPSTTGAGAVGVPGAPGLPGGSFRGPLMPHPVAMQTKQATSSTGAERRNIQNSMRQPFEFKLRCSLARVLR